MFRYSWLVGVFALVLSIVAVPHAATATIPPGCGNGVLDAGEECDNGGTCIGNQHAGNHCLGDADCCDTAGCVSDTGVCVGGEKDGFACLSSGDCPNSECAHCVPQGGDACAANCTLETDVLFPLKPGVVDELTQTIIAGTSGEVVHGNLQIPLPLTGSQTLTIGQERNGAIPVVVKAASVQFPKIDVMGLACDCVRGIPAKTCGGTVFSMDGGAAQDCTPGFATLTSQDGPCPANLPCTFVHGAGNSASGVLSCAAGLAGININVTLDDDNFSHACTTAAQCTQLPGAPDCVPDPDSFGMPNPPVFCGPAPSVMTLSGSGPAGSGILLNSTAIGSRIGPCSTAGTFCNSSDPLSDAPSDRGAVLNTHITTGAADGEITTANGYPDNTVCQCTDSDFLTCPLADCASPWTVHGTPFDCPSLLSGSALGAALAGSFMAPHVPIVGDSVVTSVLVAGLPVNTPTPTNTRTTTPTRSVTQTRTSSRTLTVTPTPTQTLTPSLTETPSLTPTNTSVPICGNGVVEYGEQCDDGNQASGDTCPGNCSYASSHLLIRGSVRSPSQLRNGCEVEWYVVNPTNQLDRFGLPNQNQTCIDQDGTCDFDPIPGRCRFRVVACINNVDPNLPGCTPGGISSLAVLKPYPQTARIQVLHDILVADRANLTNALQHLLDPANPNVGYSNHLPLTGAQQNLCTVPFDIDVYTAGLRQRSVRLLTQSYATPRNRKALSRLRLNCREP